MLHNKVKLRLTKFRLCSFPKQVDYLIICSQLQTMNHQIQHLHYLRVFPAVSDVHENLIYLVWVHYGKAYVCKTIWRNVLLSSFTSIMIVGSALVLQNYDFYFHEPSIKSRIQLENRDSKPLMKDAGFRKGTKYRESPNRDNSRRLGRRAQGTCNLDLWPEQLSLAVQEVLQDLYIFPTTCFLLFLLLSSFRHECTFKFIYK